MAINWNVNWLEIYKERVKNLEKQIENEYKKRVKDLLKLERLKNEKRRLEKIISLEEESKDEMLRFKSK